MSDQLTLVLPRYNNFTSSVSKDRLLAVNPTGFLAEALSLDPGAEVINLEQSFITPELLTFYTEIINTGVIPSVIPNDVKQLGRYFLFEPLGVITPKYAELAKRYPGINILNPETFQDANNYWNGLIYSIVADYPELLAYILSHTPPSDRSDPVLAGIAVLSGNASAVQAFLKRVPNIRYISVPEAILRQLYPEKAKTLADVQQYINPPPPAHPPIGYTEVKSDILPIFQYAAVSTPEVFRVLLPLMVQNPIYLNLLFHLKRFDLVSLYLGHFGPSGLANTVKNAILYGAPDEVLQQILYTAPGDEKDAKKARGTNIQRGVVAALKGMTGKSNIVSYDKLAQQLPEQIAALGRLVALDPSLPAQVYQAATAIQNGDLKAVQDSAYQAVFDEVKSTGMYRFIPSAQPKRNSLPILTFLLSLAIMYKRDDIFKYLYGFAQSFNESIGPREELLVNAVYNNRPVLVDYIQHTPSGFGTLYTASQAQWRRYATQKGYREVAELLKR